MKIDTFALTEHMTTDSDMDSKHSATDDLDITDLEIADLDLAENQHESNQNHRMIDADNHGINHHERNTALQGNLARSQAIPKSIQEAQSQHKSLAQTTTPPATNQMSLTQKNNMNKMLESHTAVTQKTTPMKTMLPESGFLRVDQLRRTANLAELPPSTRRIKPLNDFLGQHRARAAVETALSLPFDGYNIFAVGTSGLGKRTMLKRMLAVQAAEMPTPSDWVYVNNFANPRQPTALELPPSDAPKLKKLVHQLWNTIFDQLEKTFAADSYHTRIENIRQSAGNAQQLALQALTQEGEALALKLVSRNEEHRFVPVKLQPIEDPNAAENAQN
jgi:hypothetical protein